MMKIEPVTVRQRAMELFTGLEELEEPELLLFPVLMDAISIVEVYRRAKHQVAHLPELTKSVDALLKELEIVRRTNEWSSEVASAA